VREDGNDVLAVYDVTKQALERARNGAGVTLIELVTYRRKGHAEHDAQGYQPKEEITHWATTNDPLDRYEKRLDETGWIPPEERSAIRSRIEQELNAAVATAENEPFPEPDSALTDVYADPAVQPAPWYRS
jgi:pyruvate dehydrogenase E1 component alpha subunit/2-oxoisovalerate dehydrogenase E1 component alpha subunit